jgi:peptidoglycan/LPS O-acetylase OafA/YrhL
MLEVAALPKTDYAPDGATAARFLALPQGSPSVHLDALRGFAAFSVLLNHWRDAFFVDYQELAQHNPLVAAVYLATGLGHQWVIVFFVLSGYLVGGSVLRLVESGRWSWRGYLLARLTRLYIVLLPALVLGGAFDWAGTHLAGTEAVYSGHSGMHALITDVHSTLTLPTLAANSLFLQTIALPGMGGRQVSTFGSNGPLWSLSNEFWYYLAFPLLALLLAKARSWRVRVACGLGLVTWGWFVGSGIALLGIPWLMGVLIVYLPPFPARRPRTRGLAISAALAILGGGLVLAKIWHSLTTDLALGLAVTLLIWVTLHCATAPLPARYARVAQRAARSSYTLYLVHFPLLIFLKASLHLPRAFPGWQMGAISVGLLVGILLYAQLVYQLCERNTDRVRNWIKPYVMGRRPA